MNLNEIGALLGRRINDQVVLDTLARFGIDDVPTIKSDPSDPDGPVVGLQDWVLSSNNGIEFGFDDEAAWLGWSEIEYGRHPMLLTQIYLYGHHAGVNPFCDSLPFGLNVGDDRETVRSKMAVVRNPARSYIRDTWETDYFRLIVSYKEHGRYIDFVLCSLREPPLPERDYDLPPAPSGDEFVRLLGISRSDERLAAAIAPLGRGSGTVGHHDKLDLRYTYGIELEFAPVPNIPGTLAHEHEPVLTHVSFCRSRELGSRGWKGRLPFGLSFDESPTVAMQKIGHPPDEQFDEDFTGFASWQLAVHVVHIFYSTMENVLLRVKVSWIQRQNN